MAKDKIWSDPEYRKQYFQRYAKSHAEKIKNYRRNYYQTHKQRWIDKYNARHDQILTNRRKRRAALRHIPEFLAKYRVYQKSWREQNKGHLKEYFRNYGKEHSPYLRTYHKNYYQKNKSRWVRRYDETTPAERQELLRRRRTLRVARKEEINAKGREYRRLHRDKIRARERTRRMRGRDKKLLTDRIWRENNREKHNESIKRSKRAKPGLYRMLARLRACRRRSRLREAIIENVRMDYIFQRDRMNCHLCGTWISETDVSLDHLIPVVRRGSYAEWNLMLAHLSCNRLRRDRQILLVETREAAETYIANHEQEIVT